MDAVYVPPRLLQNIHMKLVCRDSGVPKVRITNQTSYAFQFFIITLSY